MAVLYDGNEPMLTDMQWSTNSAYQIHLTFYVISQPPTEDLLRQTVTWHDDSGRSICIEMARAASRQPGRVAECRGDERTDVGSNLRCRFEGKMKREVERPLIVEHRLPAVFRAALKGKWRARLRSM
jgi:hypothetical protein